MWCILLAAFLIISLTYLLNASGIPPAPAWKLNPSLIIPAAFTNFAVISAISNLSLDKVIAVVPDTIFSGIPAKLKMKIDEKSTNEMTKKITENLFKKKLMTANIPDPDLVIRTSGEQRLSNFLLWQIAYSELYFTKTLWPDYNSSKFQLAINNYIKRKRRFGKDNEIIT